MDPLTTASRSDLIRELNHRHRDLLRAGERLELVTQDSGRGIRARLTLSGGADGTVTELEARIDFQRAKTSGDDALGLALDALDLTLGEYLESGRGERLPAGFEERDLDGRPVSLRGRVRRPAIDEEANRLLGEPTSRRATARESLSGSGAWLSVPGSSASCGEVPRVGGPLPGAGEPTLVIELGRFTVERATPAVGIQVVAPAGGGEFGEIGDGAAREGGEISVEGSSGGGEGTDEGEVARWRRSPRESRAPPEGEEGQARAELVELGADEIGLTRRD